MPPPRSPLAPAAFPAMPPIPGVRVAGMACGLKPGGVMDLFLADLAPGTAIAGVLTRSKCPAATVDWCRQVLPGGRARALVVNSGNANAFTGDRGQAVVARTVAAAVKVFGCPPEEIFVASTGVIGEPQPPDHIADSLAGLSTRTSAAAWPTAAEAIMTTDTFPKGASRRAGIAGAQVTLNGIAKGSGMIGPDMATMLAFVFTDAAIDPAVLQVLVRKGADRSFNCITVDGDTSTNDTLLLLATGKAEHPRIDDPRDPRLRDFTRQLDDLMIDLAQQIARDGEGAQKLVTIHVSGAASARAARRIGLSIGNSPLVKTAIAGEDANWGRIVMAVGKAGERAERDRLSIAFGGVEIARDGRAVAAYDEAPVSQHLQGREIQIAVDVGVGRGKATVWTCDLTHGYVEINADYRS
jgi:glutamate N-acetyltransferase/amino-acid N-acetyltransferase